MTNKSYPHSLDKGKWWINLKLSNEQIVRYILKPVFKLMGKEVRYYEG